MTGTDGPGFHLPFATLRCVPPSQLLAFPLSSSSALPWVHQSIMEPVAWCLSALAALPTTSSALAAAVPLYLLAVAWIAVLLALALVVATSYHRDRDNGALPVKVRAQIKAKGEHLFHSMICVAGVGYGGYATAGSPVNTDTLTDTLTHTRRVRCCLPSRCSESC